MVEHDETDAQLREELTEVWDRLEHIADAIDQREPSTEAPEGQATDVVALDGDEPAVPDSD